MYSFYLYKQNDFARNPHVLELTRTVWFVNSLTITEQVLCFEIYTCDHATTEGPRSGFDNSINK